MTDRKFIKLNTSIQTASNAGTIHQEPDGTIPAVIELRLPDNLYSSQTGGQKVDSVSMLTTKLRLSLLETPIAQIPLDTDLSRLNGINVSKCKLDVYPWAVDDNDDLKPSPSNQLNPNVQSQNLPFPAYKQHNLKFTFTAVTNNGEVTLSDIVYCTANDVLHTFPKTSRFYTLMERNNALGNHLLNMTVPNVHETLTIENDSAFVKNISTLEQMWNDALENAITFALSKSNQEFEVMVVTKSYYDNHRDLVPTPNINYPVEIPELHDVVYYWKTVDQTTTDTNQLLLKSGLQAYFNNNWFVSVVV